MDFISPCSYGPGLHYIEVDKNKDFFTAGNMFTIAGPGDVSFRLTGLLTIVDQEWEFLGRISGPPNGNRFNFDPRPDNPRAPFKEWIVRRIHADGRGTPFLMIFDGEREIAEEGCCPAGTVLITH